jgi:putative ABC transport system permease protein
MLYLMKLAFRNIWRNKRRSILAFTSVALSIAGITFFRAFAGGMLQSIVKNSTKNETGHIRITTKKFREKAQFFPVTENIRNADEITAAIRGNDEINRELALVTERMNFGVLLANKGNNKYAAALAGDPAVEKDLLLLQKSLREGGRYIQGERETMVGAKIADALNLAVGDTLKVMTTGADYALHMRKFAVVGVFETGLNVLDDKFFQIPLEDARHLLRTGDGVQQIIIMLKDYEKATAVAGKIRALLNNEELAVVSWTEHGEWASMVDKVEIIYSFLYFLIAFLGAFIITNILMMVVLERRKEIGIVKSMGISRFQVMMLFLFEGTTLGLIGSLAGMALGMAFNIYFAIFGLDFSTMLGSFNFPIDSRIFFDISPGSLVNILMIGVVVSALVSVLPSWRASRMNAVDAIKSV